MKKFLRILYAVGLAAAVALFTGCGNSVKTTGESDVKAAGTLTVLVPFDGSSYAFQDEKGEWAGIEIELMNSVANSLGVNVTYVGTEKGAGLPEKMAELNANLAVGRITESNYRDSSEFSVSRPYDEGRVYAVTPRGVYFPTLTIFDGKKVGFSPALSDRGDFLASAGGATAVLYKVPEGVADALYNADIAAYFCYRDEANSLTAANDELQSQDLYGIDPEKFVVAARPAQADLLNTVNAVIGGMTDDGSLKAIIEKYNP